MAGGSETEGPRTTKPRRPTKDSRRPIPPISESDSRSSLCVLGGTPWLLTASSAELASTLELRVNPADDSLPDRTSGHTLSVRHERHPPTRLGGRGGGPGRRCRRRTASKGGRAAATP